MRRRGYSDHDLDLIITMHQKIETQELEEICTKWNNLFVEKFELTIDCIIQTVDRKPIYDYDYRIGLCDGESFADLGNRVKCLDGKWVKF
jgi:hypothetical protein